MHVLPLSRIEQKFLSDETVSLVNIRSGPSDEHCSCAQREFGRLWDAHKLETSNRGEDMFLPGGTLKVLAALVSP